MRDKHSLLQSFMTPRCRDALECYSEDLPPSQMRKDLLSPASEVTQHHQYFSMRPNLAKLEAKRGRLKPNGTCSTVSFTAPKCWLDGLQECSHGSLAALRTRFLPRNAHNRTNPGFTASYESKGCSIVVQFSWRST